MEWILNCASVKQQLYFGLVLCETKVVNYNLVHFLNKGPSLTITWFSEKSVKCILLTHSKGAFIKKTAKKHYIFGLAGQIKSFRGPNVVHACPCSIVTWFSEKSQPEIDVIFFVCDVLGLP